MRNACDKYNKETISRYIDDELSLKEKEAVLNHIKICDLCNSTARKYSQISEAFKQETSFKTEKMNTDLIFQNSLQQIRQKDNGLLKKLFDYFSPKLYLKIASIVILMVISLVYFQLKPITGIGPSAIVKSVNGNISSVMILKTKNKEHTIIWFSET